MARRLLVLLSLLVLFVLAWIALPDAAPGPAVAAAPHEASAPPAEPASLPSATPRTATPHRESLPALASPAEASAAPPIPADAQWIEVKLVDQRSGAAVADAEVAWMDPSTYQRTAPADAMWAMLDREAIARAYGWRTRSDVQGMARVHLSQQWISVFARSASRYGNLDIQKGTPPPAEGYRLELVEDRELRVAVLDAAGQPAPGVMVEVVHHDADGKFLHTWASPAAQARRPDGIARIAHMQEWDAHRQPLVPVQWHVRVRAPGVEDPGVVFDPKAPPAEPVVLRLPACGSVTARVELGGRTVTGLGSIGLMVGTIGDSEADNRAWRESSRPDGVARFAHVPVGVTYRAFAYINVGLVQKEFAGPTAPGQDVPVVLEVGNDYVVLSGRLVDDQQEPQRNLELWVEFSASTSSGNGLLHTDAEGRFLFFLGASPERRCRLERFVITGPHRAGVPLRGQLAPRDLPPGVADLGDVVLEAGPLVVGGRFLEGTAPYPGSVHFLVERLRAASRGNPKDSWESVRGLTMSQGRDGSFEARGEVGPGRYRLCVGNLDHLPVTPVEFTPGTKDLVVQIARGEVFAATLLLPPDLPWGLQAWLEPPIARPPGFGEGGEFMHLHDRHQAKPMEGKPGRYQLRWQHVAAGTYTLEFRLWGVARPLLSIPDVKVPATPPNPRLVDIDLRDKVEVLTVRLVNAAGRQEAQEGGSAFVFVGPLDPAAAEWLGYPVDGGTLRMPVIPGPVDLMVASETRRPRQVEGARGQVDVFLEPWLEQEFRFPDLPALPAGFTLEANVRARSPHHDGRYLTSGPSGYRGNLFCVRSTSRTVQDGRVVLPIGTGPHRLQLVLCAPASGGRSGAGHHVPGTTPMDVAAGPAPIEVRVPADGVQKALEELQGRRGGR